MATNKRRPSLVPDEQMSREMWRFLDGIARAQLNNTWDATTAPGATDDQEHGYDVGSQWIDQTADKSYICVDSTTGAAVWKQTG